MDKFINKVIMGDCLEKLKELPDNSVDSIVTDPPYELGFMGKTWDNTGIANNVEMWKECLRVLKPGGHLLAFSGTRTYHRMASAIEDAGFEVRDMIEWVYGSGFPKSLNIGKAVDKIGGQSLSWFIDYILNVANEKGISRKELTMLFPSKNGNPTGWLWNKQKTQGITLEQYHKIKEFLQLPFDDIQECEREIIGRGKAGLTSGTIANFTGEKEFDLTKGTSEWEGWGTALKPSHEPICMARKPLSEKTVAENCLKWGTGGINVDESRVGIETITVNRHSGYNSNSLVESTKGKWQGEQEQVIGRFPANFIHDNSEEVRECFPETKSVKSQTTNERYLSGNNNTKQSGDCKLMYGKISPENTHNDSGNASRFFKSIIYTAKASKSERQKGCEELYWLNGKQIEKELWEKLNQENETNKDNKDFKRHLISRTNIHPTVKNVSLMSYLIKMVTPKGGIVLDPFTGSGSTLVAAKQNGYQYIGIELTEEYIPIIEARLK